MVGALVAIASAVSIVLALRVPKLPLAELRQRHALPGSQIERVRGIDIHMVAEGRGPLVVMLHGHLNSLRLWDAWAADLRRDHRVLRFDMPWYGLSSPGEAGTPGVVQTYQVLADLLERHGSEPVVLVGTANGGPPLAWYASLHPGRVRALVLINTPFEPPKQLDRGSRLRTFLDEHVFDVLGRPRWATAWFLGAVIRAPEKRTPELVDLVYDLKRRQDVANALPAFGTSTRFQSAELNPRNLGSVDILAGLSVPVLIQWSGSGYLQVAEGEKLKSHLPGALFRVYPKAGHWLPADDAADALGDLRQFID